MKDTIEFDYIWMIKIHLYLDLSHERNLYLLLLYYSLGNRFYRTEETRQTMATSINLLHC